MPKTEKAAQTELTAQPCTDVGKFLRLLHPAGNVFEVRSPKCPDRPNSTYKSTASGYFRGDDIKVAATTIDSLENHRPPGIYVTMNPVACSLLGRANCRIQQKAESTTADSDILSRRWFVLDIDPVRPSGISSSDGEMSAALELANHIRFELGAEGWNEPIIGMSGNGAYLLYRTDLPNDASALELVNRALKGAAVRFDTEHVKVDTSVGNAARIIKVLGTMARKGDDLRSVAGLEDRPHRRSWFVPPLDEPLPVTAEHLESLANSGDSLSSTLALSQHNGNHNAGRFNVDSFFTRYGLDVAHSKPWKGTGRKWTLNTSPLCEHHDGAAFIVQQPNGAISAGCHHNSCNWDWSQLRAKFEPNRPSNRAVDLNQQVNHRSNNDPAPVDMGLSLASPENRTEAANARRLIATHGQIMRWVAPWSKWLVWDGRRWAIDQQCRADALAKEVAAEMWRQLINSSQDTN